MSYLVSALNPSVYYACRNRLLCAYPALKIQMAAVVHFGHLDLNLDLEAAELRTDGRKRRTPERQFQILHMLLAKGGGGVSRDETASASSPPTRWWSVIARLASQVQCGRSPALCYGSSVAGSRCFLEKLFTLDPRTVA